MKKPSIPSIPGKDKEMASVLRPIKENIESITGVFGGKMSGLNQDATLPDVINKINEIIDRLN